MSRELDELGERYHKILHRLWSKAGTNHYEKAEWRELEAVGYALMKAAHVAKPFGLPGPGDRIE